VIRIRTTPEDFRVDEQPLYAPSGAGAHTFVRIEKRLRTTEAVARDLARAAGARPPDVGYAGRKDRGAVATQWFSVPDLDPEAALALDLPGARVLEAARHPHKLRTGQLRANRFAIRLRGVDAAARARAEARCAEIRERGMPNRFGAQRFGRDGDNALRARRFCAGEITVRDRRDARFLVSAWQSEVFNAVLAARPLPLDQLEAGDLAMRHDSGGVFLIEDPARERERARAFEISPTGPIFGPRMTWPGGTDARRLVGMSRPGRNACPATGGMPRRAECMPGDWWGCPAGRNPRPATGETDPTRRGGVTPALSCTRAATKLNGCEARPAR